ncbi:MAG: VWA domain-containing protein [Deltaproteobacteria bacterium]|nr:VWA domain-containing protein [Deltaproteobacteria bacterium]
MQKTPTVVASCALLLFAPGCLGALAAAAFVDALPCDGKLVEELQDQDGLSDECRADIAPYLPDPQDSFDGRLVVLGEAHDQVGAVSVFVHGVDELGSVLDESDWADARVTVWADGEPTEVPPQQLGVEVLGNSSEPFASIAIVNDYSASMLDSDLDDVEALQLDVLECLPPAVEGSVTYFSEAVSQVQDFTEDRGALLAALQRDDDFDRDTTALYDGMGQALEQRVERDRPVRVLLVSSDGLENASTTWTEDAVLELVEQEDITVVMLGALLADLGQMRDLTQHDGVYFYTPFYADMHEQLDDYVASLKQMARLTVPVDFADADRIEIEVGGHSVTVPLSQ